MCVLSCTLERAHVYILFMMARVCMCSYAQSAIRVAARLCLRVRVPRGICFCCCAFITQTVAASEHTKNGVNFCADPRLRGRNSILPLFAKVFAVACIIRAWHLSTFSPNFLQNNRQPSLLPNRRSAVIRTHQTISCHRNSQKMRALKLLSAPIS